MKKRASPKENTSNKRHKKKEKEYDKNKTLKESGV